MGNGWRLLVDEAASGAWNMSVDEALLEAVWQGLAPITLRFYRWQPATVSLGYFQPAEDVDLAAVERLGLGLVRRPTGGRAILHDDELTYSLVIPAAALPGGRSVGRSYLAISRALLVGLQRLGLAAQVGEQVASRQTLSPACFALATRADLQAAGHKLVGSAQVRRGGVILQHGSLPLTLNRQLHAAVFGEGEVAKLPALGLAAALGRRPSWEELVQALALGFRTTFGVSLQPGALTASERAMARRLERTKYGTPAFTLHAPPRAGSISKAGPPSPQGR
jgi:lipoate-protein ligase A